MILTLLQQQNNRILTISQKQKSIHLPINPSLHIGYGMFLFFSENKLVQSTKNQRRITQPCSSIVFPQVSGVLFSSRKDLQDVIILSQKTVDTLIRYHLRYRSNIRNCSAFLRVETGWSEPSGKIQTFKYSVVVNVVSGSIAFVAIKFMDLHNLQ